MFTERDNKELKRLMQKRRRANNTGTRKCMFSRSLGEKGRAARKKYMQSGGNKKVAEQRKASGYYEKVTASRETTRITATNARRRWTKGQELELSRYVQEGKTSREIGKFVGRSMQAVEHKRATLIPPNAEAQLPPERPQAAEGTQSAPALWAVNCSDLLGDCIVRIERRSVERRQPTRLNEARSL
jgi:hypothetical protein